MDKIKFVILGPSSSSKTTVSMILQNRYGLPIFECDNETRRLNKGYWPRNVKVVDKFFTQVNKKALEKENIVYITSFLDEAEIVKFTQKAREADKDKLALSL
ncbi:hypothetical protein HY389_01115, partial [Candidatus Daviesbacteria bacterium]|nr:hypothetical protein [Candidatus Daviesbacteria bacterium]